MKLPVIVLCSLFLVGCGGESTLSAGGNGTPAANVVEKKGGCCSDKAAGAEAKGDACCSEKATEAKGDACCSEKAADAKKEGACCADDAAKTAPKSPN